MQSCIHWVPGSPSSGIKGSFQCSDYLHLPKLKLVMFGVILTSSYASMACIGTNAPVENYGKSDNAYT
jgi:hypothetical protein